MCTVTFIPANNRVFITSNRDEKLMRRKAQPPQKYTEGKVTLLYPKDAEAGGTWIAMNEDGNAAVLLNGAFIRHAHKPPYRKSRGVIFLEIISGQAPAQSFKQADLTDIEPFTLVIFEDGLLYECRWDSHKKHFLQLNNQQPYIWSSATLYDEPVVQKREQWFNEWLQKNSNPTQQDIFHFHQFTGDDHDSLRINRNNTLLTVSITGMELTTEKGRMQYLDLINNTQCRQELQLAASRIVL